MPRKIKITLSFFKQNWWELTYSFGPLDKATEEEWLHLTYVGFYFIYLRMETEFNSETLRVGEAYT